MRSKIAVFRRCPAFSEAEPATLRVLHLASRTLSLARRAPLRFDDVGGAVLVGRGLLREGGDLGERPVTFGFFGRADLVASASLFGGASGTSIEAYEDSVVLALPPGDVERCMARDPGLCRGLLRWEHQRRAAVEQQLVLVAHGAATRCLAWSLLRLAERFGVRDSRGTILPMRLPHRELAALIGTTRETASLAIGKLRRDDLVQVQDKRIVLLDRKRLARIAAGEPADG